MKQLILGLVALMALTFVACESDDDPTLFTVGFEDVTLDADDVQKGDTISGSIISANLAVSYGVSNYSGVHYYSGFTVSAQKDTLTAGYTNPYSCIAAEGAEGSTTFAVCYGNGDSIKFDTPVDMESVMLCNNTYAYLSMRDGDWVGKKFGGIDGTDEDYFMLTVELYDEAGDLLGEEDFYLADFRGAANYIIKDWTELDLSTYTSVSYLKFDYESTDIGTWGYNTPTYFCIDNISYYSAE